MVVKEVPRYINTGLMDQIELNPNPDSGIPVLTVNSAELTYAPDDIAIQFLLENISRDGYVVPDDILVAYLTRLEKNDTEIRKIAGLDIMNMVIKVSIQNNLPIVLTGASDESRESALSNLRYRDAKVVGSFGGRFNSEEDSVYILERLSELAESGIKPVLLLAGSTPGIYKWIADNYSALRENTIFFANFGRGIDMLGGEIKRPPEWMLRYNLEGVGWLLSNPTRNSPKLSRQLRAIWSVLAIRLGYLIRQPDRRGHIFRDMGPST